MRDVAMTAAQKRAPRRVRPVRRWLATFLSVLLATLSLQVVTSVVAAPAASAAGGAGTGGMFVPVNQRLLSGVTMNSLVWNHYQLLGQAGIPSANVEAVLLNVTVYPSGANSGDIEVAPNTAIPSTAYGFLVYGPNERASSSGVVQPGTDGKIAIRSAATETNVFVDIQGYFTVGNGTPAPGGFVPITPTRIVNGASYAANSTTTVQGNGVNGIPTNASGLMINTSVTASNPNDAGGAIVAYPTGTARPGVSMPFSAGVNTLAQAVDLSSAGQFDVQLQESSGPATVSIDVTGYFNGDPSLGGFTPNESRLWDSYPNKNLAPGATVAVQVTGVGGMPAASPSISAFAFTVEADTASAGSGSVTVWSDDVSQPSVATISYDAKNPRNSNMAWVRPGATDGKVNITNNGTATMRVALVGEGYMTNPGALAPSNGTQTGLSGARSGADMFTHGLTDRAQLQLNPTNGNLTYTQGLFNIAGVGLPTQVQLRYNSLNDLRPTLSVGRNEAQLFRNANGSITYTAPDGGGYTFIDQARHYAGVDAAGNAQSYVEAFGGSTTAGDSSPVGMNATLTRIGSGTGPNTEYDLTMHPSQVTNVYVDDGSNVILRSTQDVTGANKITYTYSNGVLASQTDTQGRTLAYSYTDPNNPTQPSLITDNSLGRTVHLTYAGPSGALSKVVDAAGETTQFGYGSNGKISTITDPRNTVTVLAYGPGNTKLSSWELAQGAAANVDATTQFAYPSATSTVITDPNNHSGTYTLATAAGVTTVTKVTDALGHGSTAAWAAHGEIQSATSQLNDTTSYGYANSTYNTTSVTAPTVGGGGTGNPGRSEQFHYGSAAGPSNGTYYTTTDFRPDYETDADTNKTTFSYNKWGELKVSTTAVGSVGTTSSVTSETHQSDESGASCGGKSGQLCKKTLPLGGITSYSYDAAGNLATLTPPAPLGVQTFTHDAAGRVTSVVDGRSTTTWTCYDPDDRILQTSTTSSTCATASGVTYTFDADGNLTQRQTAATGIITTISYDQQNRPTQKAESNGTSSVSYDGAGNLLTYSDPAGTTTYTYDAANNVSTLAEPGGSCPAATTPNSTKCVVFGYDGDNRRTDTKFPSGVTNHTTYDASSRILEIKASNQSGTVLADRGYARLPAGVGADSGLVSKITDSTGTVPTTTYGYDGMNRLLTATVAGSVTNSYAYDADSNIVKKVAGATTTYYGTNTADQICWSAATTGSNCTTPPYGTSYTYDGNGNQTGDSTGTANTWTGFNQLASTNTGGNQNYSYAGTTNTQRVTAGGTTFTNGLIGGVTRTTGGPTANYIHDPNGTLIAMQYNGHEYYYTGDLINSTILITNETQAVAAKYTYDPYGNTTSSTGDGTQTINPWRYTGGWTDTQTGLIKFGARYYNPTLGRFTQRDPSGQETNSYAYAGDNPISNSDPSGLNWLGVLFATAALAAAVLATVTLPEAAPLWVGIATSQATALGIAAEGYEVGESVKDGWSANTSPSDSSDQSSDSSDSSDSSGGSSYYSDPDDDYSQN